MEAERLELLEARVQLLSEVLREVISAIARIDEAQGKRLTAIAVEGLLAQSKQARTRCPAYGGCERG
jgi:hypothetical protein